MGVRKILKYLLCLSAFLFGISANATQLGGFFAKDVCDSDKCYQALSHAENAFGKQLGYEYSFNRFEGFVKEKAEKQAYKAVDVIGAREPFAILLFIYKVKREGKLTVPIVKKKSYLTLTNESVSVDFRNWKNLNFKIEVPKSDRKPIYSVGLRFGI